MMVEIARYRIMIAQRNLANPDHMAKVKISFKNLNYNFQIDLF